MQPATIPPGIGQGFRHGDRGPGGDLRWLDPGNDIGAGTAFVDRVVAAYETAARQGDNTDDSHDDHDDKAR